MIKRSTMISLRIDNQDLDDYESHIKAGEYKNVSTCIRELAKIGYKLKKYQEMMKDPMKAEEFQKKMQEVINNNQIIEYAQTLTVDQLDGFIMLCQMEKDKRYEQKRFL